MIEAALIIGWLIPTAAIVAWCSARLSVPTSIHSVPTKEGE